MQNLGISNKLISLAVSEISAGYAPFSDASKVAIGAKLSSLQEVARISTAPKNNKILFFNIVELFFNFEIGCSSQSV